MLQLAAMYVPDNLKRKLKFYCEIWLSQNGADQDSYNLKFSSGKYCQTFRETFCGQPQGQLNSFGQSFQ